MGTSMCRKPRQSWRLRASVSDGGGRADGGDVDVKEIEVKKGQLIRFVIHPRGWWGSDLTAIENLKIEKE